FGMDLELAAEALGAAQAEAQAGSCGVTILHCQFYIGNSGTMIFECEAQSFSDPIVHRIEADGAAAAIDQGIPRQFAGRGDDLGLIHQSEAQFHCPSPHLLTDQDDVGIGTDRYCFRFQQRHGVYPSSVPALSRLERRSTSIPFSTLS